MIDSEPFLMPVALGYMAILTAGANWPRPFVSSYNCFSVLSGQDCLVLYSFSVRCIVFCAHNIAEGADNTDDTADVHGIGQACSSSTPWSVTCQ